MIFLQKFLNVFVCLSLLSISASTVGQVHQGSLWGKVMDFNHQCRHLTLKPHVSIPALQEFTVCLHLKFEVQATSPWIAFIYHHPDVQYSDLVFGGKPGYLVVWMFGREWTSPQINLELSHWYSLCLSWSHTKDKPALYVDGNLVAMMTDQIFPPVSSSDRTLAPNGTFTLGVANTESTTSRLIPFSSVFGKLSLFRLWGRERNEQEVTSLYCTEGDLINWATDNWDTGKCELVPDSSLNCEWSLYEVRLRFAIICHVNNSESYIAREIAHHWIREVLPANMYLNSVFVFEITRSSPEGSLVKTSHEGRLMRWVTENIKRFDCVVHVSVIPSWDVPVMQNEIYIHLKTPYNHPNLLLQLLPDDTSIHTTPIENFSSVVTSPPDVVTMPSPTYPTTTISPLTFSPSTTTSTRTTTTSTITSTSTGAVAATTTTRPTNVSELYFEVKVNVSITGDCDPEQTVNIWLNSSLPDDMMMVLSVQLLPKAKRYVHNLLTHHSTSDGVFGSRGSSERCIFQVRVTTSLLDTREMEKQIRDLLLIPYNNGSTTIAISDIKISRILILECKAESVQTRRGLFHWPATSGGKQVTLPCPKNPLHYGTRQCKLSIWTQWMSPDLKDCALMVQTLSDLDHIEVNADNALDVVEMIESLLSNHSALNYQEMVTVLNKLEDIINLSVVTPNLGKTLISIISDILESDSYLAPFTNTILNITEAVGDRMVGYQGSSTLIASAVAVSVVDVDPGQFNRLTFGVSSDHSGKNPEIFINSYPFKSTLAFISLPSTLQHRFPQNGLNQSPPRIQFQFYGIPMLFKNNQNGQTLNTFVVSASVTNATSPIKDLDEDIKVTLHHLIPNTVYKDVQCVYWNFNKNDGHGGWDGHGCRKYNSSSDYTTCLCNHLTHFGVLLDVSRTEVDWANEQILTIITYVGCGLSSLFLGVTVLTYTVFDKLRRDYPSQILINLSLALLGLNLMFLVNSWLSSWGLYPLCVTVASVLHYFLLASFTWMGLEAVNMYFALVKVFNVYVPSYILKFCALGWGLPLMVCITVLIVNREAYGSNLYADSQPGFESLDNSNDFCWLQDNVTFYVSVIGYAMLIFLFNTGIFVVVLIQIRNMRINSPAGSHSGLMRDLKSVASLTLLLGLTWTVGFFTFGLSRVVMLYLFSGLNSLQGLFIFLFHCLMKENVRKQWRIHLCLGRFRLEEYSEWSNSASAGVLAKPRLNPTRASVPSVHSIKSSSTESTSASSNSSQRDTSCKRQNLGLFVTSLALPRAQRSPSDAGGLPSLRGLNQDPGRGNRIC